MFNYIPPNGTRKIL